MVRRFETPNIDALAARGLRYTNWHTTALCSPTRSCLLTGRNNHTNGMGMISELAQGYPGYDGMPKPSRGYISELLQAQGFATYALGKWHQVPAEEMSMAGPYTTLAGGQGLRSVLRFPRRGDRSISAPIWSTIITTSNRPKPRKKVITSRKI